MRVVIFTTYVVRHIISNGKKEIEPQHAAQDTKQKVEPAFIA